MAPIQNWRRLIVGVLATLLPGIASADAPAIRSADDLNTFFTQYYRKPQPDSVSSAIEFLGASRFFQNKGLISHFLAFFAHLYAQHPERVAEWTSTVNRQDKITRDVLSRAMAASSNPKQLVTSEAPSPARNDMCWGAFLASGDEQYVTLIILQLKHMGERQDQMLYFTAASAKWSLASNARQHSRVRLIIERTLSADPPPWNNELLEAWRRDLAEVLSKEPGQIQQETNAIVREQRTKGLWLPASQPAAAAP